MFFLCRGRRRCVFPSLITPGVFLLFYSTVCPAFSLSFALYVYFIKGLQSCIEILIPQVEELLLNSWSNLHDDVTKLYTDNFTIPFPDYGNTTVLRWRGSLENSIFWPNTHSWCIHLSGKTSLDAWLWDESRQLENGNYLYLNYEERDYESPVPVFGP